MDCGMFTPGHLVHWIQWRKVNEEGDMEPARVVDADAEAQTIVLEVDGEQIIAWNHDVPRIIDEAAEATSVTYSPRWHVLQCNTAYHYLATNAEHWKPVCAAPRSGAVLDDDEVREHLLEFGGLLVRASDALVENLGFRVIRR